MCLTMCKILRGIKRAHVNVRKDKAHQSKTKNDSEEHTNVRYRLLEVWKLTE